MSDPRDVSDVRDRILDRGKTFFGTHGISIAGHEGAYTLTLRPSLAKYKHVFSETVIRASTLDAIESHLNKIIRYVGEHVL